MGYTTNEFKIPTMNTKKIHAVAPENTIFFEDAQPSGEANATGTPTIRTRDNATKAKSESWKRNNM
jgi:hypothetical protein